MHNPTTVNCECGRPAKLVDIGNGKQWQCETCNAWVQANENSPTYAPRGKLADGQLRFWKTRARDAFNLLWVPIAAEGDQAAGRKIRVRAYKWIAAQLGIDGSAMHFDHLSLEQCQRIYAICSVTPPNYFRG